MTRIARWTKDGQGHDFGYDDLGNLTLHAGETQVYDAKRRYAIARRDLEVDVQYSYDADGNVVSIVGGPTPQHFAYDSANRMVRLGSSAGSCSARVAYDANGKRVAEYQTGTAVYTVYVGDDFVWEDRQNVHMANVEVRLGDQRVALKRFQASRRGSGAGFFAIALPVEWGVGGGLVVVVVLLLGARRSGHLVLVYRQPIRAATAVGSALSIFIPHVAVAGGIPLGSSPSYYWEIADPLGMDMVMLDQEGARVRHQTFSPFGRVHAEVGGSGLRTFYAGHRRAPPPAPPPARPRPLPAPFGAADPGCFSRSWIPSAWVVVSFGMASPSIAFWRICFAARKVTTFLLFHGTRDGSRSRRLLL